MSRLHDRDEDLLDLYRGVAVERPSAAMDAVVLSAAAADLQRRRYLPWAAIAATLLVAATLVPLVRGQLAARYDHEAADQYLMQVQAPITPETVSGGPDEYLLDLPPIASAGTR